MQVLNSREFQLVRQSQRFSLTYFEPNKKYTSIAVPFFWSSTIYKASNLLVLHPYIQITNSSSKNISDSYF